MRFPNVELADIPSDLERTLRTAFAILMDMNLSVDDTTLISVLPGSVVVQVGTEVCLDSRWHLLSSYQHADVPSLTFLGFNLQTETVFTTVAGAAAFATRVDCCSTNLFNRTFHDGACTQVAEVVYKGGRRVTNMPVDMRTDWVSGFDFISSAVCRSSMLSLFGERSGQRVRMRLAGVPRSAWYLHQLW